MKTAQKIGLVVGVVAILASVLPAFAIPMDCGLRVQCRSIVGRVESIAENELVVRVGGHTLYTTTQSESTVYRDLLNRKDFDVSWIEVGDHVKVYGTKNKLDHTMTDVTKVIDKNVRTSSITGTVTGIETNAIEFRKMHHIYTTTESESTIYLDKQGEVTDASSIEVDDKIRVWGMWHIDGKGRSDTYTIDQVTKIKEISHLQ